MAAPDPAAPPRILLTGECSTPAATVVPLLPSGLSEAPAQGHPTDQARPHHPRLEEPLANGPPVDPVVTAEQCKSRRLKSVFVAPSSLPLLAISGLDGDWTEGYVVYRRVLRYYSGEEDGIDMRKALSQDVDKKSIIPLKRPITPDELEYD
ncbi:hypothetical protein ZWY2020_040653 [Hordeum vulgare]|nr:hypothetical protein ZWY2020_040653 [Hordeum vulgare]